MATEVLAIGTTAANSSDIVVAAGSQVTLALKSAAGPLIESGYVKIQIKADSGEYFDIDKLTPRNTALVIAAAGTYRVSRIAGGSCGVFRD